MAGKTYQRYRKRNTSVRTIPTHGRNTPPDLCPNCHGTADCPGCAGDSTGCAKCIPFRAGACPACDGTGATL